MSDLTEEARARGRQNRIPIESKRVRIMTICKNTAEELVGRYPNQGARIGALAKGSRKAAIELKCLDCCCGERLEVKNCSAIGCPLWPVRPWQIKSNGVDE